MGADLSLGSRLFKIWGMDLRLLKFFLGNERKTLGWGALTCVKKEKRFGVATGGSPRVAPEGGSDSARQIQGLLSKKKQPYDLNFHIFF